MPCYHPLHGFRSKHENPTGKRSIVFKLRNGLPSEPISVPCGRCIGCKLERSRQWAVRCLHEAALHEDNCFVTLTYDNDHLPYAGTLVKSDLQKFIKRLRKSLDGKRISYYACGEYGDEKQRPHYHAILFGVRFLDQQFFTVSNGLPVYTSASLSRLWPSGHATVGEMTFESAAYVARYCLKKITGKKADEHYTTIVPETGEIFRRVAEYNAMSLKPAIGKEWLKQFRSDVYPSDEIIVRGKQAKPPRYYDKQLEALDAEMHAALKADRKEAALEKASDQTKSRLLVREEVKMAQVNQLKRTIE